MTVVFGIVDGIKCYLQHQHVTLLLAQPRRLLIVCQCQAVTFYCLCLHAPDIDQGAGIVASWWDETRTVVSRLVPAGASLLCGVDGNFRIREAYMPWIGNCKDPPGQSGTDERHIVDFTKHIGGSIVNTHPEFIRQNSQHGTFLASDGFEAVRCDYIII